MTRVKENKLHKLTTKCIRAQNTIKYVLDKMREYGRQSAFNKTSESNKNVEQQLIHTHTHSREEKRIERAKKSNGKKTQFLLFAFLCRKTSCSIQSDCIQDHEM